MSTQVPHSRPCVGAAEAQAVERVMLSGQLAQGAEVEAFEAEVATACGRRFGVAVSSGTAGLHLALLALGVGAGGGVGVPSYVCMALLQAVRATGAQVVALDVDPVSGNLPAQGAGAAAGLDAVIVPHLFGLPAAVEAWVANGVPVVEDCAMALGAPHAGRTVGAYGALSVCSFYATKMLTTGEGGMVLTDDADLAAAVRGRRQYDGLGAEVLRFNCKMTDVAAACGRVQLGRLPEFVARRRALAARYDRALADSWLRPPPPHPEHVYYRYVVDAGAAAPAVLARLAGRGVAARRPVSGALHRCLGMPDEAFPGTCAACHGHVSVPLYPALAPAEAEQVIGALDAVVQGRREWA